MPNLSRRRFALQWGVVGTVGGVAGCSGNGSDDDPGDGDEEANANDDRNEEGNDDDGESSTSDDEKNGTSDASDDNDEIDEHTLATDRAITFLEDNDAHGFDGEIVTRYGTDVVTVDVGTDENGFGIDPVTLSIDVGTTVVWDRVDHAHPLESTPDSDFDFAADLRNNSTARKTFEDEGVALYACEIHGGGIGECGAIIVREN